MRYRSQPTICVVGSGLAGLATALNIKKQSPTARVLLVEKSQPQRNTQIAGMRFRLKKSGSPATDPEAQVVELSHLLASQNEGRLTSKMVRFAELAVAEVKQWTTDLYDSDPALVQQLGEWFGPQWGKLNHSGSGGRGLSVVNWLKAQLAAHEVEYISGEITQLVRDGSHVTGLIGQHKNRVFRLTPDITVLANGNAGGTLYESTNKAIHYSASELLYEAGFGLEGATLNMWHPFGLCNSAGETRNGCYETDVLAGAQVWLADGVFDAETTQLLAEHQAHYYFPEICQRLVQHGSQVELRWPEGERTHARVSLHYSHLGAQVEDEVRVKGSDNLFVVGDAGGLLQWTEYRRRLPGFALSHCLVSARLVSQRVHHLIEGGEVTRATTPVIQEHTFDLPSCWDIPTRQLQKRLNTEASLALTFGQETGSDIIANWREAISRLPQSDILTQLTGELITVWSRAERGEHEPLAMTHLDGSDSVINRETRTELRPLRRRL
jgi:hypothetical protein